MITPLPTDALTQQMRFGDLQVSHENIYWTEGRPLEKGRSALMWIDHTGQLRELTPDTYNIRTRVHEYGGGACAVHSDVVVFSNFSNNALYRLSKGKIGQIASGERYADFAFSPDGKTLYCVIESGQKNGIARIDLSSNKEVEWIISGEDFYSSPRVSPDGKQLAYVCWNHPNMPWDFTHLYVCPIGNEQARTEVAGERNESVIEPRWSAANELYFLSDRGGYWSLYRYAQGSVLTAAAQKGDVGDAQWVFGTSHYALTSEGIALVRTIEGVDHLVFISPNGEKQLPLPYTYFSQLQAVGNALVCFAAGPHHLSSLIRIDLKTGHVETLRQSTPLSLSTVSAPESIAFPTAEGKTAYGFYYPPLSGNALPPVLINIHGGPTGRAVPRLALEIQYWTSRGFGFFDLNYGGSTGYGREYRQRLNKQWGIVDVTDAENAVRYLIAQGKADPKKIAIRGGSAGGYTALLALTKSTLFSGAASYFGVTDLALMIEEDAHKFESRYFDTLIGPYPEEKELYIERSPIHYLDKLSTPLILFQGGEDKIVPPSQSEHLYKALQERGITCKYLLFPHEGHGFRSAQAIKESLEAELAFYRQINFH